MLEKKEGKEWSHSLFKRSDLFKKYWFIEAFVILVLWIVVIVLSTKSEDGWVKSLSWLSMHIWIFKGKEGITTGSYVTFSLYLAFVLAAIFLNIYKRFRVCSSLSCYLGDSDEEKFKTETKALNMATAVSSFGMVFATPIVYFLSFLFRIIFLRFISKEEKKSKEEVNTSQTS